MFAVIGKALGCQSFRQELWGEMLSTGLTEGEIEDIVNNLASPALDDRESRLIPLARQTVQYRTHELNERAAKALAGLSRDEVMDAIGIVSLANAVFRLSALLDEC